MKDSISSWKEHNDQKDEVGEMKIPLPQNVFSFLNSLIGIFFILAR